MSYKKIFFLFLLLIGFTVGCKKESADQSITANGELIDGGSSAVDGSGFFIRLDNNDELKPDCLPEELMLANTRVHVKVSFTYTTERFKTSCGSCPGIPVVHIHSIKKL